jgi:DNA-directed RNA polymerase alpha subunit
MDVEAASGDAIERLEMPQASRQKLRALAKEHLRSRADEFEELESGPPPSITDPALQLSLAEIGINKGNINLLEPRGVLSAWDLLNTSEEDLMAISNFGPTKLTNIRNALSQLGYEFADYPEDPEMKTILSEPNTRDLEVETTS